MCKEESTQATDGKGGHLFSFNSYQSNGKVTGHAFHRSSFFLIYFISNQNLQFYELIC
jgi:hypothetical protein